MSEKKYAVLRVTLTEDYLVPISGSPEVIGEGTVTEINGWTLDEVNQSWFRDFNINSGHASRDFHRLGGGRKVLGVDLVALSEVK